jgi:hypothetical protein
MLVTRTNSKSDRHLNLLRRCSQCDCIRNSPVISTRLPIAVPASFSFPLDSPTNPIIPKRVLDKIYNLIMYLQQFGLSFIISILHLIATATAQRPAHKGSRSSPLEGRQILPFCFVSCGDGWCCLEYEKCVATPNGEIPYACADVIFTNADGYYIPPSLHFFPPAPVPSPI